MAVLPLSQLAGWRLADPSQDLRGRQIVDRDGSVIGTVTELPVNTETELIDHIVLDNGYAVPLRRIEIDGKTLRLR